MTAIPEERWIAHGMVLREDRALFIRRNEDRYLGGWWDVPGGQVESGELPPDAAVRELREESGLEGSVVSEITRYQNSDTEGREILFHTVTFRLAERDPRQPVEIEPQEHFEYRWATFSEAAELRLVWHVRKTVDEVFGSRSSFGW